MKKCAILAACLALSVNFSAHATLSNVEKVESKSSDVVSPRSPQENSVVSPRLKRDLLSGLVGSRPTDCGLVGSRPQGEGESTITKPSSDCYHASFRPSRDPV